MFSERQHSHDFKHYLMVKSEMGAMWRQPSPVRVFLAKLPHAEEKKGWILPVRMLSYL